MCLCRAVDQDPCTPSLQGFQPSPLHPSFPAGLCCSGFSFRLRSWLKLWGPRWYRKAVCSIHSQALLMKELGMENPAQPRCRSWSSQPWLGLWRRRAGLPRWHVAVLSGVPGATFQPGDFPHCLLLRHTRGGRAVPQGCAAGTQRSSSWDTGRAEEQVGQEELKTLRATGRRRKVVNPPGRSHRKLISLLQNKQQVELLFLTVLWLPRLLEQAPQRLLSVFAFLSHLNPRDPCPTLLGSSSSLEPVVLLPALLFPIPLRNCGLRTAGGSTTLALLPIPAHPRAWK